MKKLNFYPTLTLAYLLATAYSIAQAPQKISYQAIVRDAAGQLIANANVGIRITILQGNTEGSSVYVESHTAQSNTHGVVSVQIGAGTNAAGSIEIIEWSQGPYFIRAEIDPQGGSDYRITVASELLSVPYALFATNRGVVGPQGPPGPEGPEGAQGIEGEPGPGIEGVEDNGMGKLTFHFDDGTSYTTPVLTGPQGPKGSHDLSPYLTTTDLSSAVPDHETDPVFTASPSSGITGQRIATWETAYGWGDHGAGGYLKIENQRIDDVLLISTNAQNQPIENLSKLSIGTVGMQQSHPSAILDVNSETKGFLVPRMPDAQMRSIVNPAAGLMIYNTDQNKLQYFNGGWQDLKLDLGN